MVKCLLCVEGMRDDPAPDGTTGFALSLAQLNKNQTLAILESGLEPREATLFLAREFVALDDDDPEVQAIQITIKDVLSQVPELVSFHVHTNDLINERYSLKVSVTK